MMRTIVLVCALAACSKPVKHVDGWGSVDIGTVFESETVTRLQRPFEHVTAGTIRQTLVARNDSEASVRLELSDGTAHVVTTPLERVEPEPCPGTTVTTSQEKCTTPVGTFDCTRTSVVARQNSSVTWTAKAIPVPIKSIVTNDNLTTTTELTRLGR